MNRLRPIAALSVITTLFVVFGVATSLGESNITSPETRLEALPLTPDLEAAVEAGVLHALSNVEAELTEQAADIASTSTTTTAPPSTTTTTATPDPQPRAATTPKAAATTTTTSPPPAKSSPSGGYVSSAENDFASKINSYRAKKGESSLKRSGSLDSYARSWAKKLAERGSLAHSSIGSLLGTWSAVGENVGMGGSVGAIFDALVASSGHRQNMLGDFTHFGIGVYRDSDGTLWTAHVFAR